MNINKPTFIKFPKMARLTRQCVITEKIDGTNASITITEDGQFLTGSRTRWITPEDDNFGFAKWANDNKESLLALGVGTHFGEWWGSKIQRGYGLLNGEHKFSLFDTIRWCLNSEEPKQIVSADSTIIKFQQKLPACCNLVPVLYTGIFDTSICDTTLDALACSGSLAAKGFMKPEGIVCFHVAAQVGFKKTIEEDEQPKSRVIDKR